MLDGDRLVPVSTPETILARRFIPMAGVGDAIVAPALPDPSGPAVAWRLDDTGTWTELGPWDITVGRTGGTFELDVFDGTFIEGTDYAFYARYREGGAGSPIAKAWRSVDGLHWDQVLESPPRSAPLAQVGAGIVAMRWVG